MKNENGQKSDTMPESVDVAPEESAEPLEVQDVPPIPEEEDLTPEEGEPGEPEDPSEALQQEKAALTDRLLRLQADFDNFRKRTARDRTEVARRTTEDLIQEILSVLDHFALGLANAREHDAKPTVLEGFELVYDQLLQGLGTFGLQPIDATGEPFNPNLHEALTQLPSTEVPTGHVIEQTRQGYKLGERLLRPAQVVVSSGESSSDSTHDEMPEETP